MAIDSEDAAIITNISIAAAIISLISCFLTVYLVRAMKRWNGYLLLICSLSICQTTEDFGLLLTLASPATDAQVCVSQGAFLMFGGMVAGFWTNAISFSIFYIVYFCKSFNIFRFYGFILLITLGLSFAVAVWGAVISAYTVNGSAQCFVTAVSNEQVYDAYLYLHYLSFAFNVVFSFATLSKVFHTKRQIRLAVIRIRNERKDQPQKQLQQDFLNLSSPVDIVQTTSPSDPFNSGSSVGSNGTAGSSGTPGSHVSFTGVPTLHNMADRDAGQILKPKTFGQISRRSLASVISMSSIGMVTSAKRGGDAIFRLSLRMCLYPLLQGILEIFRSWDKNDFDLEPNGVQHFWPHFFHVQSQALSGLFYLIIFLVMQPKAYIFLKKSMWESITTAANFICRCFGKEEVDKLFLARPAEDSSVGGATTIRSNQMFQPESDAAQPSHSDHMVGSGPALGRGSIRPKIGNVSAVGNQRRSAESRQSAYSEEEQELMNEDDDVKDMDDSELEREIINNASAIKKARSGKASGDETHIRDSMMSEMDDISERMTEFGIDTASLVSNSEVCGERASTTRFSLFSETAGSSIPVAHQNRILVDEERGESASRNRAGHHSTTKNPMQDGLL